MKLFLDTAELDEIRTIARWGVLDGVTTNPSLFAKTSITSFLGTDLRHVKGLTQKQLDVACGDATTKLPPGLHVHTCQ